MISCFWIWSTGRAASNSCKISSAPRMSQKSCPSCASREGAIFSLTALWTWARGLFSVPQVESAEQAAAAVSAAKFSPVGTRGTCRFTRSACYGADTGENYFTAAQDTMVMIQAEGAKAIENIDAILDVAGIDVIFVGPYDLSASLGTLVRLSTPRSAARFRKLSGRRMPKASRWGALQTMPQWRGDGETSECASLAIPVI